MDDLRTMGRLRERWQSARNDVNAALSRAGYDPARLEELPQDVPPGSALAGAIARWREAEALLTAGEERSPARRG